MIHYQLRCATGHEFDGWFRDSGNFDRQAERKLIACPNCGGTDVARALMAPALRRKGEAAPALPASVPLPEAPPAQAITGVLPDTVRAALQKLRVEVEKTCDYVGADFAEEARRMHNGETPVRGIYGEASEAEAESLAEDGIDVARIPWLPRAEG